MIDALASEYGWSIETIMETPLDQVAMLIHAALYRKGVRTFLRNPRKDPSAEPLTDRVAGIFAQIDTTA
jgi:hypothetical protein